MLRRTITPSRAPSRVLVTASSLALLMTCGAAFAYDEKVEKYCGDDYLAYCSRHAPESAETRYCMEAHRDQLSKQCVKTLVEAGLVPKKYMSKKLADSE